MCGNEERVDRFLFSLMDVATNRNGCSSCYSGCFAQLQVLALNGCNISSWAQLQLLEPLLPSLEELYVASNSFSDLPIESYEQGYRDATGETTSSEAPLVTGFHKLRILDVSACRLEEWSQVQAFGLLPSLQELILDGNEALRQVVPPAPESFRTLYRMSLSGTGYVCLPSTSPCVQ